jgi:hypothetical protein
MFFFRLWNCICKWDLKHSAEVFEGEKKHLVTQSANAECDAQFKQNGEFRIQDWQKKTSTIDNA